MTAAAVRDPLLTGLSVYEVGGAVRDRLLGLPVADHDWVVVGAHPQQLLDLGFKPVGADFPVFLHPVTGEEYAMARTERKTGRGYHGFAVFTDHSVTLEDDLRRRDLTINAMAMDARGNLIDPYHGERDLRNRVFRHVSMSFREDPVRILRLARFAARYADFTVADETMGLMRQMVEAGEVDALVSERIWKEVSRGLMEPKPSRMFEVLRECGALARVMPELDRLWGIPQPPAHHPEIDCGVHTMMVIDQAAAMDAPLPVRFACLTHDLGKGTTDKQHWPRHINHELRSKDLIREIAARWPLPREVVETATLNAREHTNVHQSLTFDGAALMRLLERSDALRKQQRFEWMLQACEADAKGRLGREHEAYPQRAKLMLALNFARIDTMPIAMEAMGKGMTGEDLGTAIRAARIAAIKSGFRLVKDNAVVKFQAGGQTVIGVVSEGGPSAQSIVEELNAGQEPDAPKAELVSLEPRQSRQRP